MAHMGCKGRAKSYKGLDIHGRTPSFDREVWGQPTANAPSLRGCGRRQARSGKLNFRSTGTRQNQNTAHVRPVDRRSTLATWTRTRRPPCSLRPSKAATLATVQPASSPPRCRRVTRALPPDTGSPASLSRRHAADLVALLDAAVRGELTLTLALGKPGPLTGWGQLGGVGR